MGKDIGGSMIRPVNKKEARSTVKGVEFPATTGRCQGGLWWQADKVMSEWGLVWGGAVKYADERRKKG